jgi:hypothetical protein
MFRGGKEACRGVRNAFLPLFALLALGPTGTAQSAMPTTNILNRISMVESQ